MLKKVLTWISFNDMIHIVRNMTVAGVAQLVEQLICNQ